MEEFTGYQDDQPYDCLVDLQGNIIVYDDWYGIYSNGSWQFFEGFNWEGERLEVDKIFGYYENNLFVITWDHRLFSYSMDLDELSYIGTLEFIQSTHPRAGIASGEMLWLSHLLDNYFYSWTLPLDDQNLTPQLELYSENNFALGAFVDQDGRTWVIREDDILVAIDQEEFVSIKPPFQVDRLDSVYFDENTNMIYIGTEVGVFRSNVEKLSKINGLSN